MHPTREQSQAVASRPIAASRHAECGKERRSVGTQSGPGLLDRATEPQVALSKICLAQDGAQDGPTWTWFAHGGLRSEDHYAEGVRNGVFRAWHSNGRPRWEGSFRQGREQGLWRAFDCDGVLRCEGHAEGGRIAGAWRCASAEPLPLVDYNDALLDGLPVRAPTLDLGCGTGRPIADYALARGHDVTGVDQAGALRAITCARLPQATC